MASKDVCSPWPWKCSPTELSQALKEMDDGNLSELEAITPQGNILELSCQEGYYAIPAEPPKSR